VVGGNGIHASQHAQLHSLDASLLDLQAFPAGVEENSAKDFWQPWIGADVDAFRVSYYCLGGVLGELLFLSPHYHLGLFM
jgi:hypothetical protein